jgi:hypothetical protein
MQTVVTRGESDVGEGEQRARWDSALGAQKMNSQFHEFRGASASSRAESDRPSGRRSFWFAVGRAPQLLS